MIGEIIAIGDELTTGRIANTTSGVAARELFAAGHEIHAMHTIGDTPDLIGATLKAALVHTDFVIITGGLGATTDDLTNEAVVKALGLAADLNPEVLASLKTRLPNDTLEQKACIEKLAWLPQDAKILDDGYRMAGYLLQHEGNLLFFLPGVPPQMEELLTNKVVPYLHQWSQQHQQPVCQQLYRTFGLPESEINNRLLPLENTADIQLGYYPVDCEVHVSLTIRNAANGENDQRFIETDATIREAIGSHIYGTGHQSLAAVVGHLLVAKARTLCVAESCTGGLIGSRITEVAGSSQWFAGGVVAYSNQLKELLLNVDRALLDNYGAVSPHCARAMAARLAARLNCEMAVSVTGIAGPDGGSKGKPVGTVYIGLFHDNRVSDHLFHFTGTRRQIQDKTAHTALDLVRRALIT